MLNTAAFRLVACLGNPGAQYSGTRHNIGFQIADELARRSLCEFHVDSKWNSETAQTGGRTLMKPQTFMNLSGEAVCEFARYFRITPQEVLVIIDDISLPLGNVRIRKSGSAGGHNGLESILVHFGTEAVPRLRVGIGAPGKTSLPDHVLGRFEKDELPLVEEAVLRAADAFEYANARGIDAAMNQFNQKPQEP